MKQIKRFLLAVLCAAPFGGAVAAPVATTAGSNLTAYNPNVSLTGNQWVTAMNPRNLNSGQKVEADFGNCNALILRCAQPKCSGTGCSDASVATSIVTGCIQANDTCKQYADQGLTEYIVGQLVASSSAKADAAALAVETAKAQAAAAQQNSQQLQDMQIKMQQMQNEMANQNAATIAELKNALEEQKALNAAAQQPAQPVQTSSVSPELTTTQQVAIDNGISAEIMVRQQINGQIMTEIENAETQLKTLKATMYQPGGTSIFTYAGCDSMGNGCTGPKRVRRFKELANGFFEPYDAVYDHLYDALITAQTVGVDINDIYMMMNDACNVWGQYACSDQDEYKVEYYNSDSDKTCVGGVSKNVSGKHVRGGLSCMDGQAVPPEDDVRCMLIGKMENSADPDLKWDFLNPSYGAIYNEQGGKIDQKNMVRVGCQSARLAILPGRRRSAKQASVDIDTLQLMVNQDAPTNCYSHNESKGKDCLNWCYDKDAKIDKWIISKSLDTKICSEEDLYSNFIGKACDDSTAYVSPYLTLCSVHAYNIGKTSNNDIKDATIRSEMNDIIAKKATVITQQMYKQYDTLEKMVKKLKVQLEKAVLTSTLQVAGAKSERDSGSSSSNSRLTGVSLDGASNCNDSFSIDDTLQCLQDNYRKIQTASANGTKLSKDITEQLKADSKVTQSTQASLINCTAKMKVATDCNYITQVSGFQKCLNAQATDIRTLLNCREQEKTKNTWPQFSK